MIVYHLVILLCSLLLSFLASDDSASFSDSESASETEAANRFVEACAFSTVDNKKLTATNLFDQSAHEFFDNLSSRCGDLAIEDLRDHNCQQPESIQRAICIMSCFA